MAHELDLSNGRENMAYVGAKPWHGLGVALQEGESTDAWRVAAGMDWEIRRSMLKYSDESNSIMSYPDRNVLYRSDTKGPLGIVSNGYKVVQPAEVMNFFSDLVGAHGFKMETAGCLFGGRKFWALARTGESVRIMGQDEVAPYLLLATSCDGSMSTCAHFTSVRVVCNNTLRMSVGSEGQKANVRVPHNAMFDPDSVKERLGVHGEAWGNFVGNVELLSSRKIARDEAIDFMAAILKTKEESMEGKHMLNRVISLFDGQGIGSQLRSSQGTAWGLLNAVTEYCDHEAGAGNNKDTSRAFERAHLTDRARFKVQVANELLKWAA